MNYQDIIKYGEIQYLKGRLDELYKGYVPDSIDKSNRIVDSRISKYEKKLQKTDEISFYLYQTEQRNVLFSKQKSKKEIKNLLIEIIDNVDNQELIEKIKKQIEKY